MKKEKPTTSESTESSSTSDLKPKPKPSSSKPATPKPSKSTGGEEELKSNTPATLATPTTATTTAAAVPALAAIAEKAEPQQEKPQEQLTATTSNVSPSNNTEQLNETVDTTATTTAHKEEQTNTANITHETKDNGTTTATTPTVSEPTEVTTTTTAATTPSETQPLTDKSLEQVLARVQQLEALVKNATNPSSSSSSPSSTSTEQEDSHLTLYSREDIAKLVEKETADLKRRMQQEISRIAFEHETQRRSEREELLARYKKELQSRLESNRQTLVTQMQQELQQHEQDLNEDWTIKLNLQLSEERASRLLELESLFIRVKALESILDSQSRANLESQESQNLWVATSAFVSKTQSGLPFREEAQALREAGSGHAIVQSVLDSIPDAVIEHGPRTHHYLAQRFLSVRQAARQVAFVPSEESGMVAHALSRLFSFFTFERHGLVSGDDVDSIFARAEYYLNHGDLDSAARQLNQLKGWPRKLAQDWLKEARAALEVDQAANILLAFASLVALGKTE